MTDIRRRVTNQQPPHGDFESFFVESSDFHKIETYLKRFNPIKVMKMEDMEIRHSAILGWLLDPTESHGFSDEFLKAFLTNALLDSNESQEISSMDVAVTDMRNAQIIVEKKFIDLFVYFDDGISKKWVFIIENKFHSKQGKTQLEDYYNKVKKRYGPNFVVTGIFLTLNHEKPNFPAYSCLRYKSVVKIIDTLMETHAEILAPAVSTFLSHYLDTLKDRTGMNDETKIIENLARELYFQHKKVIDYVSSQGGKTRFTDAIERIFGEVPESPELRRTKDAGSYFALGRETEWADFIPEQWAQAMLLDLNQEGSYPTLLCWFELEADEGIGDAKLHLRAWLNLEEKAPGIEEMREAIVLYCQNQPLVAVNNDDDELRFFDENLNFDTISNLQDTDQIVLVMETLLKKYKPIFEDVAGIIKDTKEFRMSSK